MKKKEDLTLLVTEVESLVKSIEKDIARLDDNTSLAGPGIIISLIEKVNVAQISIISVLKCYLIILEKLDKDIDGINDTAAIAFGEVEERFEKLEKPKKKKETK